MNDTIREMQYDHDPADPEMLSNCCGATASSTIDSGIAICSDCGEWADFEAEEED